MAKRRRHPGVVLIKPEGRHGWRARYTDPDNGKTVKTTLSRLLRTAELREDWAVKKSKEIARRKLELEGGAPRATGTALSKAIEIYFEAHRKLSPRTLAIYRRATDKLVAWAGHARAASADALNRAKLMAFRAELVNAPRRNAVAGGKRGERTDGDGSRAAPSVNQDLRAARTVLGYLADADMLPHVTHDDLRRALKRLPVVLERPDYLNSAELRALLEAALSHDEERFAETRAEHARHAPPGSTARYEPIAPFVATMVLSGLRVGHAVELDWGGVGEFEVAPGGGSATKRPGVIDLEVVPELGRLLGELRPKNLRAERVFPKLTMHGVDAALLRLIERFGAPAGTTWQKLRRTCGCFLTNAPGIFGGASAYRSAAWLGHSVQVAERHYVGVVRGIPREARTLEAAMGIEALLERVVEAVRARRDAPTALAG